MHVAVKKSIAFVWSDEFRSQNLLSQDGLRSENSFVYDIVVYDDMQIRISRRTPPVTVFTSL